MHLFLFNGPPRVGKNTAAKLMLIHLKKHKHVYGLRAVEFSLATPLKEATHALFGVNRPERFFERTKDTSNYLFFGMTPRQAYINMSEKGVKPQYGKDFFGKVLVNRIEGFKKKFNLSGTLVVITDCGFKDELMPVIDYVGKENMTIIQMEREGCDYSFDSRSYINVDGIYTVRIPNNEGEPELYERLMELAYERLLDKVPRVQGDVS